MVNAFATPEVSDLSHGEDAHAQQDPHIEIEHTGPLLRPARIECPA